MLNLTQRIVIQLAVYQPVLNDIDVVFENL